MTKESGFRVRVEEDLRKTFLEVCRQQDSTASQEIRKFMRDYIERQTESSQQTLFPAEGVKAIMQNSGKSK